MEKLKEKRGHGQKWDKDENEEQRHKIKDGKGSDRKREKNRALQYTHSTQSSAK